MVLSRNSLIVWGNSHLHCVSRCAYGTTYKVGVRVMSGAFIVCAKPGEAEAAAIAKRRINPKKRQGIPATGSERKNRVIGILPALPIPRGRRKFELHSIKTNPTRASHAWGSLFSLPRLEPVAQSRLQCTRVAGGF